MIMEQCGQPPEVPDRLEYIPEKAYNYNRDHSLYKLRKHRQHNDCKEIFKLLENNTRSNNNNNIFVLEPPERDPFRHAEEQLCDRAVELNKQSIKTGRRLTFQIRGKKRPCKACAGYMASRKIIGHNKRSGFVYLDALARQLKMKEYKAANHTLWLILTRYCWMSMRRPEAGMNARYSYDTDSDSDQEKYKGRDHAERLFQRYYDRVEKKKFKKMTSRFIKLDRRRTTISAMVNRKNRNSSRSCKNNKSRNRNFEPQNRILESANENKSLKPVFKNIKTVYGATRHRNMKSRDKKMTRLLKNMGLPKDRSIEINSFTMDNFIYDN